MQKWSFYSRKLDCSDLVLIGRKIENMFYFMLKCFDVKNDDCAEWKCNLFYYLFCCPILTRNIL